MPKDTHSVSKLFSVGIAIRAPAMVSPKKESLEKVYFDFLSIIFLILFQIKKYQPIADRHMLWGPANSTRIH